MALECRARKADDRRAERAVVVGGPVESAAEELPEHSAERHAQQRPQRVAAAHKCVCDHAEGS